MGRIRLLPDDLVSLIAAGEVVERPASVLKELVENSLDAGAQAVRITLEDGGKRRIVVSDDGCGMDRDDALLAFERHATSKILDRRDIQRITSLGFRGEALPSIASVSKTVLTTRTAQSEEGTEVLIEGGRLIHCRPASHPVGTTVSVGNLFFNVPARRRFLGSPQTEFRRCVDVAVSLALARPEIGFRVIHNGKTVLDLPAKQKRQERLAEIASARAAGDVVSAQLNSAELFVTAALVPIKSGLRINVSVNARPIKDRVLLSAIRKVLAEHADRGDSLWLSFWVELPPENVDVNVHPAKWEVRFENAGAVVSAARRLLSQLLIKAFPFSRREVAVLPESAGGSAAEPPRLAWEHPRLSLSPPGRLSSEVGEPQGDSWQESVASSSREVDAAAVEGVWLGRLIGQYRMSYLLLETESGLVLVDQHVAHERVLYERFLKQWMGGGDLPKERLLSPLVVGVPSDATYGIDEVVGLLQRFGIEARVAEGGAEILVMSAVPGATDREIVGLVQAVLETLTEGGEGGQELEKVVRSIAASAACKAAIKANQSLSRSEQLKLLEELSQTSDPFRCPHGRPILVRLEHLELEKAFGRR